MDSDIKKSTSGSYFFQVNAKKIAKFNKHYQVCQVPGIPSVTEHYYPFDSQCNKKVKNRNRAEYEWPANTMPAYGWLATNLSIWVPSGPSEHGGPH